MSAKNKPATNSEFQDVLDRFGVAKDYWSPIYERGQEDVDFVLGDGNQWPAKIKARREKNNQPCLEENRMLPFVHQVINSIRQSRPSIIPQPVDDKADVVVAEVLRGVIRNIETTSDAGSVYDTAARNSVMASVGWIRVVTDYADTDTFDQEARLERIQNFQSVLLDPNHERQDGSDAEWGFVFTDEARDIFTSENPDAKTDGFPKSGDWSSGDTIRVAEYFWKVRETKTLCEYEVATIAGTMRGVCTEDKLPIGVTVLRTRQVEIIKIKHRKLTDAEFLGEEGEFPGKYIPLVPVYGFEVYTDGKRTFYSLVHPAKDPQRMLNYWISTDTETVALQPKTPFVGAVGQFKSYPNTWAAANSENYPFLEYDPVTTPEGVPLPPPQRQQPPTSSPTVTQSIMRSADAIKASLGMYDPSLGNTSNEISGKAIISRQMQGDNATFHFVDNLAVGIRQVGRILIDIIPIVYSKQRIVRILGEDGTQSLVPLNRPVVKQGNEYRPANDNDRDSQIISFDAGKYDVVVEVGASYATKRQEMANLLMEGMNGNPKLFEVAGDLLFKNLDVPGADEIAKRIRATMDPALLGDDVEAARVQQLTAALTQIQQKLDLTEQALLAKKDNQDFQNSLDARKVENDTIKLKIEAAKTEAEIEKIRADIGQTHGQDLGMLASAITSLKAQSDDVATALHILLTDGEEEGTAASEAAVNEGDPYVGRDIASAA